MTNLYYQNTPLFLTRLANQEVFLLEKCYFSLDRDPYNEQTIYLYQETKTKEIKLLYTKSKEKTEMNISSHIFNFYIEQYKKNKYPLSQMSEKLTKMYNIVKAFEENKLLEKTIHHNKNMNKQQNKVKL